MTKVRSRGYTDWLTHLHIQFSGYFPQSCPQKTYKLTQIKGLNLNRSKSVSKVNVFYLFSRWWQLNMAAVFYSNPGIYFGFSVWAVLCILVLILALYFGQWHNYIPKLFHWSFALSLKSFFFLWVILLWWLNELGNLKSYEKFIVRNWMIYKFIMWCSFPSFAVLSQNGCQITLGWGSQSDPQPCL